MTCFGPSSGMWRCNVLMHSPGTIRKQVGREKSERPLQKAFRLRSMMLPFMKAEIDRDSDNVRKVVGRPESPRR
jgi:hypothetical protein